MILDGVASSSFFNGDPLLHAEVARLIGKWNVPVVVETGTSVGHTTLALSLLCPKVITVEIDQGAAKSAMGLFSRAGSGNIRLIESSSPEALNELNSELDGLRVLYYLDAHWNNYWPLLDELRAIAAIRGPKPVIVIHDFQVPGHPDLGFDSYEGMALNWDYVRPGLDEIYQRGCSIHHNSLAFGCRRGVLFVEPEH